MKQKQPSSLRTFLRTKLINSSKYNEHGFFLNVQYLPSFLKYVISQLSPEEQRSIVSYQLQNLILEIAAKGVQGERLTNIDEITNYIVNHTRDRQSFWEKYSGNWHALQSKDNPDHAHNQIIKEAQAVRTYNEQMKQAREKYKSKKRQLRRFQIRRRKVLEQNYKIVNFIEKEKSFEKIEYILQVKLKEYAKLKYPNLCGMMLEYYILNCCLSKEQRRRRRRNGIAEERQLRQNNQRLKRIEKEKSDQIQKQMQQQEKQQSGESQEQQQEQQIVEEQAQQLSSQQKQKPDSHFSEFQKFLLEDKIQLQTLLCDDFVETQIIKNILKSFEILSELTILNQNNYKKEIKADQIISDVKLEFGRHIKIEQLIESVQNWYDKYCSFQPALKHINSNLVSQLGEPPYLVGCSEEKQTIENLAAEWHQMLNCEDMQNANKYKFTQASKIQWSQAQYRLFLSGLITYSHLTVNNKRIANYMGKHIQPNHVKYIKGQYLRSMRGRKGNLGKTELMKKDLQNFSMKIFDKNCGLTVAGRNKPNVFGKSKRRRRRNARRSDCDDDGEDDSSY